jgi:hypothetical protein
LLRAVHTSASTARGVGLLKAAQVAVDLAHAKAEVEPSARTACRPTCIAESRVAQLAEWDTAKHGATVPVT